MIEKLVPETLPPAYSTWMSDLLATYYRARNHPFKLRLATWLEKSLGNKNILIKTKRGFRFAANRFDYIQNTVFQTRDWEPEIGSILVQELTQKDLLNFFIFYGYSVRYIAGENGLILKSENYVAVNPDGGT